MDIKNAMVKLFLFDHRKRALFLTIVSAQLKSGRPYQDVFKSLLKSTNQYYRALAQKSLNPKSEFFASDYGDLFPERTAHLLTLSQRFNAVSEFIDESINTDKKSISVLSSVILTSMLEITMAVIGTALFVALYLYNDVLASSFADFSDTVAYHMGATLFLYKELILIVAAAVAGTYFFYLNRPGEFRLQLKTLGFYRFHDANFAIEFFSMVKIMTRAGISLGGSIKSLIDELSLIYGTNNLRRSQFATLRSELGKGSLFRSAIEKTNILGAQSLDVFHGLAPDESAGEICKASEAVADLLTVVTKAEINYLSKSVHFGLLLYLAIVMLAVVDLTLGGGISVLNLEN